MKKKNRKLGLRSETIRNLSHATGGITISPRPRTFGCPSVDTVGCLPPHSSSTCFSDCSCTQTP